MILSQHERIKFRSRFAFQPCCLMTGFFTNRCPRNMHSDISFVGSSISFYKLSFFCFAKLSKAIFSSSLFREIIVLLTCLRYMVEQQERIQYNRKQLYSIRFLECFHFIVNIVTHEDSCNKDYKRCYIEY